MLRVVRNCGQHDQSSILVDGRVILTTSCEHTGRLDEVLFGYLEYGSNTSLKYDLAISLPNARY